MTGEGDGTKETPTSGVPSNATADDRFTDAYPSLFLPAMRVAYRITGDRHVAEDIAAEAMARCYARWSTVSQLPHLTAWVLRVTTNLALDTMRRHRPAQEATQRARAELSVAGTAPLDDQAALRLALADALRRLPRRQRTAVALHHLAGLSEADVAAVLGISASTVRTHVQRALVSLRRALGPTFREVNDVPE